MNFKDFSYYKKNSLARYYMSRELFNHRIAQKKDKSKGINDFVIPILSAVISLSIAYFAGRFDKDSLKIIALIFFSYLILYFSLVHIVVPIVQWFYSFVVTFILGIKAKKTDIEDLVDSFNYEIINQTHLSYSMISELSNNISEIDKRFFFMESFFHFEKSIDLGITIINNDTIGDLQDRNHFKIPTYRVEIVIEILKKSYSLLEENKIENENLITDLTNAKSKLNYIILILNKTGLFNLELL
ncbi:MAG: hypothetical protein GQ564_19720 [Bacteroidales bacterium]|nr:hypothetical protein [Bacteroidales bacterium]